MSVDEKKILQGLRDVVGGRTMPIEQVRAEIKAKRTSAGQAGSEETDWQCPDAEDVQEGNGKSK